MNYVCKTRPDGRAFRNRTIAKPSSPVPSKNSDPGSGVGAPTVKAYQFS